MSKRKKEDERLQRIPVGGPVTWVNITRPDMKLLEKLKAQFPFFMDMDLKDCLPPYQRPKILERDQYLFMVLLFPMLDPKTGGILPYEVDFFIGRDFLVTSHLGNHETMRALAAACGEGSTACELKPDHDALRLSLDVVHEMIVSCFPNVTDVSNSLISLEGRLFKNDGSTLVKEMLRLKTNIVAFRKALQGYESTLKKLMDRGRKFFDVDRVRTQYEDIAGHGREILGFLENDRDTIYAMSDAHLTLVTYKTNNATKTLTALAFIIFPMNLVAAVFSMHATDMPFSGKPNDFWWMLATIFSTMLVIVTFLKKKKWL
ncbi:MAG TPA: CorA family divalent cation transporter [Candidatus Binatia bacterium]|nr:CorA family divalent cation transporter [Candidatus Binatia bacterium]